MQQLNRIELKGIVGNIRIQESDGNRMARIGLATNYAYKDRNGTAVVDTSWHNITAWEDQNIKDLDKIAKYTKLHVIGRIRYQSYTGVDGVNRVGVDIVASHVKIIQDESPMSYQMSEDENISKKSSREFLKDLRKQTIKEIKALMSKYNQHTIYAYDIDPGSSPVIREDPLNADFTFTLDDISIEGHGQLIFSASSSVDSFEINANDLDIETLIDVSEWLIKNEDAIKDLPGEEDDDRSEKP